MIRGNIFKNWNKKCYIARKISTDIDEYGNEINIYSKPKKYNFNIQPASGNFDKTLRDMELYGEKLNKSYRALVPMKYINEINEGDIVYLEGASPQDETEGTYGKNANYVVDSVRPQNLGIAIYFMKLEK